MRWHKHVWLHTNPHYYFTLNLIMPYRLISNINIRFGMQLALNLTFETPCADIGPPPASSMSFTYTYKSVSQLNTAIAVVEVELDQALCCKHLPPQASEAGPLHYSA